jgi:hypothetical protein
MKIVIKEITEDGANLLVYLRSDNEQNLRCRHTSKEGLNEAVELITNKANFGDNLEVFYNKYENKNE